MSVLGKLSLSRLEHDPNILLRLLTYVALLSILLILSLTAYGIYTSSVATVLKNAEAEAIRIGTVMVGQQRQHLFPGNDTSLSVNTADISLFDQYVRVFLHPFGIVKIKIFSLDRTVVYSTDKNIIGQSVGDNPRLDRALKGGVDVEQETKEKVIDLADEQLLDVDVVEAYLPVRNATGEVAGSLELYLDVTRYRQEIYSRVATTVAILAVILVLVFGISFFVVNIGAKQLKSLLSRLQKLAVTDPLTGAFNRGAVLHRAEEELSRMERRKALQPGNSLGVIMIDLDHFKKINDDYGHQAGDEVLREMTRRVQGCLREYDIFGRYGGEEFLVIIPDADFKGVIVAAERLRYDLNKAPFVVDAHKLAVTASFGVTCCYDATEGFSVALTRADEALYQAKAEGRNRVVGLELHEVVKKGFSEKN